MWRPWVPGQGESAPPSHNLSPRRSAPGVSDGRFDRSSQVPDGLAFDLTRAKARSSSTVGDLEDVPTNGSHGAGTTGKVV